MTFPSAEGGNVVAGGATTFETSFATPARQRSSRMDVVPAGPARRQWSAGAKARIIATSFEPGANIAEIARNHELLPQQLYAWRHDSIRAERLAGEPLSFVEAIVDAPEAAELVPASVAAGPPEIVIRTGALAIHVSPGVGVDHIARVLAAVRLVE
jgi:transposase